MNAKTAERLALRKRIRLARLNAAFSQERFAEALGTSRRNVMRWEKGQHKPGPLYRQRIAELTGEPEELFSDDDDEEDDPVALLYRAVQAIVREQGPDRVRELVA